MGWSARVSAALHSVNLGFFGTFYILLKRMPSYNRLQLLANAVTLLQALSFLAAPNLQWKLMPSTQWLQVAGSFVSVQGWSFLESSTLFAVVFYASLAWCSLFVGLFFYATYALSSLHIPAMWPLKLLRLVASLTTDQLYIPVLSTLLTQFQCYNQPYWVELGYTCYQGGHLAQSAIVVVLLACMVLLCSQFALLFYDSAMLSTGLNARCSGRLDFVFLLLKTALIIFCKTFPTSIGPWGVLALLLLAGVAWLAAVLHWMPYYHHVTNRLNTAVAATFLFGAVTATVGQALPYVESGVLFLIACPLAAATGIAAADWRAKSVFLRPVDELASPVEVELKCRYLLQEALFGHHIDRLHGIGDLGRPYRAAVAAAADPDELEAAVALPALAATAASMKVTATAAAAGSGAGAGGGGGGPSEAETSRLRAEVQARHAAPDDIEALLQAARAALLPADVVRIEGVYTAGCVRFRAAAPLHVAFSRWYAAIRCNKHMEMHQLMLSERAASGSDVDIRFVVFQARKRAEDSSGGNMSALLRVSFERALLLARRHMVRALQHQCAFWGELLAPVPDLGRLHTVAAAMGEAEARAEAAFAELLTLSPQSLLVLRLAADFALRVRNNPARAALLLADAERVEEAAAKEARARESGTSLRIMSESSMDIMGDATALVQISGNTNNLGTILSVNAIACRMFGYARWQLERRNVSCLLPAPMAEWHDHFLRRYLASGEGNVVDYTRVLFVQHRLGYILPALVCVREVPSKDANSEFVGLLRPLTTAEHHILMDGQYIVTAATQASLVALDLEPGALGHRSLREWVAGFDALREELETPKGATLCFDCHLLSGLPREDGADAPLSSTRSDGDVSELVVPLSRMGSKFLLPGGDGGGDDSDAEVASMLGITHSQGPESTATPSQQQEPQSWATVRAPGGRYSEADQQQRLSGHERIDGVTWARAHLQPVTLRSGLQLNILYWTPIATQAEGVGAAQISSRMHSARRLSSAASHAQGKAAVSVPGSSARDAAAVNRWQAVVRQAATAAAGEAAATPVVPKTSTSEPLPLRIKAPLPASKLVPRASVRFSGPDAAAVTAAAAAVGDGSPVSPSPLPPGHPPLTGSQSDLGPSGCPALVRFPFSDGEGHFTPLPPLPGQVLLAPRDDDMRLAGGGTGGNGGGGGTQLSATPRTPAAQLPRPTDADHVPAAPTAVGDTQTAAASQAPRRQSVPRTIVAVVSPEPPAAALTAAGASAPALSPASSLMDVTKAGGGWADDAASGGLESSSRATGTAGRSATRRMLGRLRRSLGDGSYGMLLPLRWLQVAGIAVLLVSVVLTVAVVIVSNSQFLQFNAGLSAAASAAAMVESGLRVGQSVRELVLINQGWLADSDAQAAALRAELVSQTARFASLLQTLYEYAQSSGAAAFYSTVDVTTQTYATDPVTGALLTAQHTISLHEACLEYIAEAQGCAALPLGGITSTVPPVAYVLYTSLRGSPIHSALNQSMFDWTARSDDSKGGVNAMWTAVYAAVSGALLLLLGAVFVPVLRYVDASKDEVVRQFTALPQRVLVRIREQAEANLRFLSMQDEEDEEDAASEPDEDERLNAGGGGGGADGDADEDDGAGSTGGGAEGGGGNDKNARAAPSAPSSPLRKPSIQGLSSARRGGVGSARSALGPRRASAGPDGGFDDNGGGGGGNGSVYSSESKDGAEWDVLFAAPSLRRGGGSSVGSFGSTRQNRGSVSTRGGRGSARTRQQKQRRQRYAKGCGPMAWLLVKYVGPLLLLWAFFTALFFYANAVLAASLVSSSVALAGYDRAILTMDVISALRKLARTEGGPAEVLPYAVAFEGAATDLGAVHRFLLFGGDVTSVPAVLAPAAAAGTGDSALLGASANSIVAQVLFGDLCDALWTYDSAAFPTAPYVDVSALGLLPGVATGPTGYAGSVAEVGANYTTCATLLQGTLATGGLNAGLLAYVQAATGFAQRRAAAYVPPGMPTGTGNFTTLALAGSSQQLAAAMTAGAANTSLLPPWNLTALPYAIPADLRGMQDCRGAGFAYLPRASFLIALQYAAAGQAAVAAFLAFQTVFAAVFLVLYCAFLLGVYLPSIRAENRDIHKQRGMLLLLPPPVLARSAELHALLRAVASGAAATALTARADVVGGGADGGGEEGANGDSADEASGGQRRRAGGWGLRIGSGSAP